MISPVGNHLNHCIIIANGHAGLLKQTEALLILDIVASMSINIVGTTPDYVTEPINVLVLINNVFNNQINNSLGY